MPVCRPELIVERTQASRRIRIRLRTLGDGPLLSLPWTILPNYTAETRVSVFRRADVQLS